MQDPEGKFWADPLFQLLELSWPERRPKILKFCPTRNLGHFWAALSKMSLNSSKCLGWLRRHTCCHLCLPQCVASLLVIFSVFVCLGFKCFDVWVFFFEGSSFLGFRFWVFGCLVNVS